MPNIITLNSESESVIYLSGKDKRLAKLMEMVGEITYRPYADDFKFLTHTIVGQMLSNRVADIINGRLDDLCRGLVTPENISLLQWEDLRGIGLSNAKTDFILSLAQAVKTRQIDFAKLRGLPDDAVIDELIKLKGIGNWSAKMYLIFVLNRQNVLPYEDGAFLQTYSWLYKTDDTKPTSIKKKCKKWQPYSSIGARYFYKALDYGITKEPFHLFK